MIIGINALGPISQDTGGRTYLSNLSKWIQKLDNENLYIFFISPGEASILDIQQPNVKAVAIPKSSGSTYNRIFSEHFVLPWYIVRHKVQTMYYPGNFASYYCPVPYTLAIRSMLIYNPEASECVDSRRQFYRRQLLPRSARKSKAIITPSIHTKNEIIKHLSVDDNKIHVIPHGIDYELFSHPDAICVQQNLLDKYHVQKPYFLYVSALWEYKNQDKLILALQRLIQTDSLPHQLVLIGRGMYGFESYAGKLNALVKQLHLENRVIFIDFLPHSALRSFYQNADVFLFPSLMESFGNSLFEAMAAGVPVICSNTHGFPQMLGNAALLTDPRNPELLADAIRTVLNSPQLRNNLISNGQILAKSLSWRACVSKTLDLIRQALTV